MSIKHKHKPCNGIGKAKGFEGCKGDTLVRTYGLCGTCYYKFEKQQNTMRRNKYNATKQTYNGYNYDSKMEARYAAQLDWRIKAGEIKEWTRQHKLSLDVNGVHIANYFVDFKVITNDDQVEYHEVKGAETMLWRMKWKLSQALFNGKFVLIKKC